MRESNYLFRYNHPRSFSLDSQGELASKFSSENETYPIFARFEDHDEAVSSSIETGVTISKKPDGAAVFSSLLAGRLSEKLSSKIERGSIERGEMR